MWTIETRIMLKFLVSTNNKKLKGISKKINTMDENIKSKMVLLLSQKQVMKQIVTYYDWLAAKSQQEVSIYYLRKR